MEARRPGDLRTGPVEKSRNGKNAARSDQTVDLHPKRDERGEIAEAEQARQERRRDGIGRPLRPASPESSRDGEARRPVTRDEAVESLRHRSESRQLLVGPEKSAASRNQRERAEDGKSAFEDFAARGNELDGSREGFPGDLGETLR